MSFWDFFFLLLIYIPLVLMWSSALFDIFRRDDMNGVSKALWVTCVILLPFFGTLIYLFTRPPGATPQERAALDAAGKQFVAAHTPDNRAAQIEVLAGLEERGKLTAEEFATEKARILAS